MKNASLNQGSGFFVGRRFSAYILKTSGTTGHLPEREDIGEQKIFPN
jgi:hypothetical protein